MLDIHNLLIYQGCPSVAATSEVGGGRYLDVWRVTTWYGDACGAPWHQECLWGKCNDICGAPKFEGHCIFQIALSKYWSYLLHHILHGSKR